MTLNNVVEAFSTERDERYSGVDSEMADWFFDKSSRQRTAAREMNARNSDLADREIKDTFVGMMERLGWTERQMR